MEAAVRVQFRLEHADANGTAPRGRWKIGLMCFYMFLSFCVSFTKWIQMRGEDLSNLVGQVTDPSVSMQDQPSWLRGEPATFSQSCPAPPKRAATTAEGFAHDLLMQEQQFLASFDSGKQ